MAAAAGAGPGAEGARAPSPEELPAGALEANRQLPELAGMLAEECGLLREQNARLLERDAGFESMRADLAVLQRMLSGRSSERQRPEPPAGDGEPAGGGGDRKPGSEPGRKRGPGRVRAGGITRTCRGLR